MKVCQIKLPPGDIAIMLVSKQRNGKQEIEGSESKKASALTADTEKDAFTNRRRNAFWVNKGQER